ncbi:hypothetical protein CK203_083605 [Vitis vinifera]|uniref:Uncharacterized protein n=1 Tax=Vitis vinifera TaxID=29760 RepID=A0A438BS77_VITVI|nr:hypothetical protein CK203_083605 [Vitis vinifera]
MNFMSYVAEVSRGWDEPNARDMGRMTSQPNAKGEMYILNDGIDMKVKIATMARRLEELEMKKMQEVQAISQTPLQPMPCAICLSYEHLVEECPTIPMTREMFGDCNTYNSNWRNHPNFSWKPQPPQYQQYVQALPQASNLEQAMVNLSKVMGDFVGAQKSINARLSQRIDSVESSLNKKMDGIHQMEAQKGESSMVKEVKTVITLRSGKEVNLPTCKLEHDEESETEKEKREEIKGKRKGKSIEKDDYDVNVQREPQRIVIKEEMKKKHMLPLFPQALYGKIIQSKSQRNVKRGERRKLGIKRSSKARKEHGLRNFAAKGDPLRKSLPAAKWFRSLLAPSAKIFAAAKRSLGTRVPFRSQVHPFRNCEMAAKPPRLEDLPFCNRDAIWKAAPPFLNCWTHFGALHGSKIMHTISHFEAWEVRSPALQTSCPHFEGCFAAAKPPFSTRVPLRSTRTPFHSYEMGCENSPPPRIHPPLRKCSKLKKWAAKFPFCCQMISKLPNGCEMISKLQNGYENAPDIKMSFETPLWLRNDFAAHSYPLGNPPFAAKMPF